MVNITQQATDAAWRAYDKEIYTDEAKKAVNLKDKCMKAAIRAAAEVEGWL